MNMNQPVIIIGMGQLGGVFARGFLSAGTPVYPVVRGMDMENVAQHILHPAFVLVAVSENELSHVLRKVPEGWRDRMGFLQNELLPRDWLDKNIADPTVTAVWFEKKKGKGVTVFQPTPIYGPHASKVALALKALNIPCQILSSQHELLAELVKKNLYVLTINIAGLQVGGTVGELWLNHQDLVREVAGNLLDVQEWLTKERFNRDDMISSMVGAFGKAPDHKCRGRVSVDRLNRTLAHARNADLTVPALIRIKEGL